MALQPRMTRKKLTHVHLEKFFSFAVSAVPKVELGRQMESNQGRDWRRTDSDLIGEGDTEKRFGVTSERFLIRVQKRNSTCELNGMQPPWLCRNKKYSSDLCDCCLPDTKGPEKNDISYRQNLSPGKKFHSVSSIFPFLCKTAQVQCGSLLQHVIGVYHIIGN